MFWGFFWIRAREVDKQAGRDGVGRGLASHGEGLGEGHLTFPTYNQSIHYFLSLPTLHSAHIPLQHVI